MLPIASLSFAAAKVSYLFFRNFQFYADFEISQYSGMTLDSAAAAVQADALLGLVNEFIDVDPVRRYLSCFLSRFLEESVRKLFIFSVI